MVSFTDITIFARPMLFQKIMNSRASGLIFIQVYISILFHMYMKILTYLLTQQLEIF